MRIAISYGNVNFLTVKLNMILQMEIYNGNLNIL